MLRVGFGSLRWNEKGGFNRLDHRSAVSVSTRSVEAAQPGERDEVRTDLTDPGLGLSIEGPMKIS